MTTTSGKRRGRGDDAIYWDESKGSYVGAVSLGFTAAGNRRRRKVYGRTKAEVRDGLKELHAEIETGVTSSARYTVTEAVRKWLDVGLRGRDQATVDKCSTLAECHIVPAIGAAKLRDLTADDLDDWLERKAAELATSTLVEVLSILRRAITLAQRRDLVARNVAELVSAPKGTAGRPSKALTMSQAVAVLAAAALSRLHAYIAVSLLTGIRTEEARALTWDRVHLQRVGEMPPHIEVWRSVRATGDTKTKKSRRTLALPSQAVDVLKAHKARQAADRLAAGALWQETNLVFCTQIGTALDAANVRRGFRSIVDASKIGGNWTPRELRHSFVSLLSANGVPIESIAQLVGPEPVKLDGTSGGAVVVWCLLGFDGCGGLVDPGCGGQGWWCGA
ncbi:MAG: site-specific integrase, partial [Pseudonocardiaceae bacterium]